MCYILIFDIDILEISLTLDADIQYAVIIIKHNTLLIHFPNTR